MDMKLVKERTKGQVEFIYFRKNELWYITETGFKFPVPAEEVGDATFNASDKASMFMRYIRMHMKSIEKGMAECAQ
jgi:hypothetical protein